MAAVRHLEFQKVGNFIRRLMGAEGQYASSCQILWRFFAEIWQFLIFFNMAAVRRLGFVVRVLGHTRRAFGGLYRCVKFGCNRCSSFDNMRVFKFREFGLKMLIRAPKNGVLGI